MRSSPAQAPVTHFLLLANCVVFLSMLLFGAGLGHSNSGVQLQWGANFGPATQDGQWWRLVSALFIHFGVLHLLLNMWALWDIGRLVERLFGSRRFALIYLGSGVVGNLLSLVVQGNQAISGGASGAIFSLYGALLVFLWRERRQVEPKEFRWLFGGALLFTVLMLGFGFVMPGIDNSAHGGGLLAGLLLGTALLRPWTASSLPLHQSRWIAALLLVFGVTVLVLRIPEPRYLLGEELRARTAMDQFLNKDLEIRGRYGALLGAGQRGGLSFEELAGGIESHVAAAYERSFDQLVAANPVGAAPSAAALQHLQAYANAQALAARDLAAGLRTQDAPRIAAALKRAAASEAVAP
jgi:rhomboid protease GluP